MKMPLAVGMAKAVWTRRSFYDDGPACKKQLSDSFFFSPYSIVLLFYPPSSNLPPNPSVFCEEPQCVCEREKDESIADADKFTDKREGSVYTSPTSLFLGGLLEVQEQCLFFCF